MALRVRWCVNVIGSPDAIQPPMTAPIKPTRSVVSPARAVLRTTSGVAATGATSGEVTNPPYQPPNALPAPAANRSSKAGIATSHATTACRIAGSECRMPVTLAAAQPPMTILKNPAHTAIATSSNEMVFQEEITFTDVAPTTVPMRPKISAAAMEASAPIQIALQLTRQAIQCSVTTVSSTVDCMSGVLVGVCAFTLPS